MSSYHGGNVLPYPEDDSKGPLADMPTLVKHEAEVVEFFTPLEDPGTSMKDKSQRAFNRSLEHQGVESSKVL